MHGEMKVLRTGTDVMLAPYVLLLIRLEATLDSLPNIKRYAETMKVQPRLGAAVCYQPEVLTVLRYLLQGSLLGSGVQNKSIGLSESARQGPGLHRSQMHGEW